MAFIAIHSHGFSNGYRISIFLAGATCDAVRSGENIIHVHPRPDKDLEVVAVSIFGEEVGKGKGRISPSFFIPIRRREDRSCYVDLDEKSFAPLWSRLLGIQHCSLLATVGGREISTSAYPAIPPTISFQNSQALMRWAFGELTDEELLALIGKSEEERSAPDELAMVKTELEAVTRRWDAVLEANFELRDLVDSREPSRLRWLEAAKKFAEALDIPWWHAITRSRAICDARNHFERLRIEEA